MYLRLLDGAGVNAQGRGRLVDRHTVEVGGQTITAEKILVATGGARGVPESPAPSSPSPPTRRSICPSCPRIAIVGGGYIAVEFAGIFTGLGSDVDLVRVATACCAASRGVPHRRARSAEGSGVKMRTEMQIDCIEATSSDSKGGKAPFTVNTQLGGMLRPIS